MKHFRHMDTHFLSAEEIITAASYQLQFPNKTGMASEGAFGSKFVTVCVSGDAENNIHLDGYQVVITLVLDAYVFWGDFGGFSPKPPEVTATTPRLT